ncbi:MAG: redoxin domain-containing protein [SAR202 cluster bacterium]|nr:redoxin domain-containing protein [SAR202 cluster bacterium]|tara:strand:- start:18871 stop:19062 length:192 start_codon:yes stop_codon:yes gene_type:complete
MDILILKLKSVSEILEVLMSLSPGNKAPLFTLMDHNRKAVSLENFLGKKNVILVFFVLAFTDG